MNCLPRLLKMLTELAARNPKYAPARDLAQRRLYSEIHAGRISRESADQVARFGNERASKQTEPEFLADLDNELSAEMTILVANQGSPSDYAMLEELRDTVRQITSGHQP